MHLYKRVRLVWYMVMVCTYNNKIMYGFERKEKFLINNLLLCYITFAYIKFAITQRDRECKTKIYILKHRLSTVSQTNIGTKWQLIYSVTMEKKSLYKSQCMKFRYSDLFFDFEIHIFNSGFVEFKIFIKFHVLIIKSQISILTISLAVFNPLSSINFLTCWAHSTELLLTEFILIGQRTGPLAQDGSFQGV